MMAPAQFTWIFVDLQNPAVPARVFLFWPCWLQRLFERP